MKPVKKGNTQNKLDEEFLIDLQKLQKEWKANIRPFIVIFVLGKIIIIALIDRCWDRSIYQQGQSTTE